MKKVDLDLHKYPAAIRYKFLELLGIKQKTVKIPDGKYRLNLVEHFRDENREGLRKRTEWLRGLLGSEGNVVYAAIRSYQLTGGKRPYMSLKFHNSSTFTAIVLDSIETKTKGVYNLQWAILAGDRKIKAKDKRVIDGKVFVYGGKTFSTALKNLLTKKLPTKGSGILIEVETFNVTHDKSDSAFDISGWAPRFMGVTDKKPQTIEEVENQAIKDHVFQAKLIDEDGKTYYLPGASGEELESK